MTAYAIETNLLDPDIFPQAKGPPHSLFAQWRDKDPVHWNPVNPNYAADVPFASIRKGFWVLTRYADVSEVSRDQKRFSSYDEGFVIWDMDDEELVRQRANFMGMQPEAHMAVRRVLNGPFAPNAMRALTPKIDGLAAEIIDSVAAKGKCEFVFDVASKLPVYTFCELMGIPESYRDAVVEYGNALADVETRTARTVDPIVPLFAICEEICAQKRAHPDDSLISTLVHDTTLGLEQLHINMFFMVFAIAGHETTRSTAAHFIYLMNQFPDQFALLRSDVDKHLDNAIEEVLRYTSTTTNFRRTATCDTEVGGFKVKKGDKIYLSYAAANRDPAVFENPDAFDITRANANRHLSFGVGPHLCLGARLARLEHHALLRQIVTRIPDIHLAGEPEWLRSIWFNAIVRMPVAFRPE